jgi:hypothetical protein
VNAQLGDLSDDDLSDDDLCDYIGGRSGTVTRHCSLGCTIWCHFPEGELGVKGNRPGLLSFHSLPIQFGQATFLFNAFRFV